MRMKALAQMPETLDPDQLYESVKDDLNKDEPMFSLDIVRWLGFYKEYLWLHSRAMREQSGPPVPPPHHWSGVGPITYDAPASSESVVDAVFAKLGA